MTTTESHHADPANARAARAAAEVMRIERECVKAVIARRLIDWNTKKSEARNK